MRTLNFRAFAFILLSAIAVLSPVADASDIAKGRVIYNLDSCEFFIESFGPVVPETIDKFVADHAAAGISDLFINVNGERTNYRSSVWESYWDGYDPKAGNDQPYFAGLDPNRPWDSKFFINSYLLYKQGCDYPQRMIDASRKNKVSPWISLRMNDAHEPGRPNHPLHGTFWRSHEQWRLSYGLDYEQPEVREHYMKLVNEVCERYDLDGLELDFLRFWLYFRAGREHAGVKLMTDFVEQARKAAERAAKRLGHPVKLAVRVPSTPWIARRHGLDAIGWAKSGLVDLIVVSPFWPSIDSDMPIELWKGMLIGTDVQVAVGLEGCMDAGSGHKCVGYEEMRGVIASGLYRGADAVYLFNQFTHPLKSWSRAEYDQLMRDASSLAAISSGPRRHPQTNTSPWALGEPGIERPLPYNGKHGVFRIHIGPKPSAKQQVQIELEASGTEEPLEVRCNGVPCTWSNSTEPIHTKTDKSKESIPRRRFVYNVPSDAVSDGYNLIEVISVRDVNVTWVEILITNMPAARLSTREKPSIRRGWRSCDRGFPGSSSASAAGGSCICGKC